MGEEMIKNRFVSIKHHIDGSPAESDFEVKSELISSSLSVEGKEVIIVKNLYVSVDPYQINRMKSLNSSHTPVSFAPPIIPGQAIDSYGVGRVVASGRAHMAVNDLVVGFLTWGEYTVVADEAEQIGPNGPATALPRWASWVQWAHSVRRAFRSVQAEEGGERLRDQSGIWSDNMRSSSAVVSLAVLEHRARKNLGFDDAFNYKDETDLKSALKRYFPEGIDIYLDNVGGEMLEAVLSNMNVFGRVAVCGAISEYTGKGRKASPDLMKVVYNRIKIQGFLAADLVTLISSPPPSTTCRRENCMCSATYLKALRACAFRFCRPLLW